MFPQLSDLKHLEKTTALYFEKKLNWIQGPQLVAEWWHLQTSQDFAVSHLKKNWPVVELVEQHFRSVVPPVPKASSEGHFVTAADQTKPLKDWLPAVLATEQYQWVKVLVDLQFRLQPYYEIVARGDRAQPLQAESLLSLDAFGLENDKLSFQDMTHQHTSW
jgi:hypothetical protein